MQRSLAKWITGPMMFIVVVAGIAIAGRRSGVSPTLTAVIAPALAFAVAWMGWWPVLKPKTGFWFHAAVGWTMSALVLAIAMLLMRINR